MLEQKENRNFEIVLQKRDVKGNPTGRTMSYSSDDGNDISAWAEKNKWRSLNRKNRHKNVAKAATAEEGSNYIKSMLIKQEEELTDTDTETEEQEATN